MIKKKKKKYRFVNNKAHLHLKDKKNKREVQKNKIMKKAIYLIQQKYNGNSKTLNQQSERIKKNWFDKKQLK